MFRPDVIIIGAGAAGLAAARALSDVGCSSLVLEARDRIGGRILTARDDTFPIPVDLGAEFVHGRPEATWRLIREAALTAYDLPFEHWRWHAGRLVKVEEFSRELAKVMGPLSRLRGDMSFAQYLRAHARGASQEARALALDFVMGFDAADPEFISAKSIAREQEGLGDVGAEMQFRLLEGQGSLIEHLARAAFKDRSELVRRARVREIRWRPGRVEVRFERRARRTPETARASRAIITLPIGILQAPVSSPHAVRFVPDVNEARQAWTSLGYGPVVKSVLCFREPFWEGAATRRATRSSGGLRDASFLHNTQAAFPTWWTQRPLRLPVLTGWAGGPKAAALAGRPRRELIDVAVRSLAEVVGRRPAAIREMLVRALVCDWSSDPFALGAYSYERVGGLRARAALAQPIRKTLLFAGEATDTEGQASTVAGAIASGQRAAREAIRAA